MCALEKGATSPDEALARAKESLQALLQTSAPAPSEVSIAVEALETLKLRLEEARQARARLREASRVADEAAASTAAHTERLDSEIIGAKLEAGEVLTERDRIARDLARARRTLERLDEEVKEMREAELQGENKLRDEVADRGEDLKMEKQVSEELEQLAVAEKALVDVVEQIGQVRKKREELKEKLKMAQEEW